MVVTQALPERQVQQIVRSHVPLGEDEQAFNLIKLKVERREKLSEQEKKTLERITAKAKKWEDDVKSSAQTEPEHTLGG